MRMTTLGTTGGHKAQPKRHQRSESEGRNICIVYKSPSFAFFAFPQPIFDEETQFLTPKQRNSRKDAPNHRPLHPRCCPLLHHHRSSPRPRRSRWPICACQCLPRSSRARRCPIRYPGSMALSGLYVLPPKGTWPPENPLKKRPI